LLSFHLKPPKIGALVPRLVCDLQSSVKFIRVPSLRVQGLCQEIISECRERTDPVPMESGRGNFPDSIKHRIVDLIKPGGF
jgi:hypothetical protein